MIKNCATGLLMAAMVTGAGHAQTTTAHGIATFGEIGYPADFTHLSYVNPDAPKGGEMSGWAFGSFDSMHPYTTKGRSGALASGFFESLMEGVADEIGTSYCLICTTLEYPDDRAWVIFNMRDDVRFSDGTPLTAEDVLFSYELFREKGLPSFRAILQTQVAKAEVLDPLRIKFTFAEGIPTRDLPDTVGGLPIFSKAHYIANNRDFEESSLEPLLGSGAYVLARLEVGQTVVLERNRDYWAATHPLRIGTNNFDTLRVEYYADYNAAFEGFKGGSYTFRTEAASKIWATGYDFPAVTNGAVIKAELPDGTISTGQSFIFNLRRDKFKDPRVREALGLMFNFEWSNETLFYGIYDRITSFWGNTDLEARGLPDAAELAILEPLAALLPAGVLTEPAVVPPVSGDRQLDRGALRRASALLEEAGWIVGDDGIRRKDGKTLRVEFLNDSQTFDRVINPYVENLLRLGVDAKMVRVDNAQMTQRERSYDFDMITHQVRMGYIPGAGLKQWFGSETANTSVFNLMGLADPGVDALIKVVEDATTQEELTVAVRALDRVLRVHKFWVPQWFKPAHTVAYYDYFEYPEPLPPYALGEMSFWWANMDKYNALKQAGAF
jgi:microcin C transport system substrate-binding protein